MTLTRPARIRRNRRGFVATVVVVLALIAGMYVLARDREVRVALDDGGIDDSCPATRVPDAGFTDVPATGPASVEAACLVWWGIASGVAPGRFAPDRPVERGELATLVARLLERVGTDLPGDPPDLFGDDERSVHEGSINTLADLGIVAGRSGRFAPGHAVTRAQVASVLAAAYRQAVGQPLPDGPDAFSDDDGSVHEPAINAVAAADIARGVAGDRFAPAEPVSRGQLSAFLARLLDRLVQDGVAEPPR